MPLIKSTSKAAFSENVREMVKAGHPQKQAVAAAYATQRAAAKGKSKGGFIPTVRPESVTDIPKEYTEGKWRGRAMGGVAPMMAQAMNPVGTPAQGVMPMPTDQLGDGMNGMLPGPAGAKPLKRGGSVPVGTSKPVGMTTGPLVSNVPGRTDLHFTHVPSGAYVIPADIVSAHGQGNTLAGIDKLHKMFNLHKHNASTKPALPHFPSRAKKFAKGGKDKHIGKPVPVKLAGGEIVLPPSSVHETMQRIRGRKMTMDEAHQEMDKWVVDERKKLRKTLAKLPGPARD